MELSKEWKMNFGKFSCKVSVAEVKKAAKKGTKKNLKEQIVTVSKSDKSTKLSVDLSIQMIC